MTVRKAPSDHDIGFVTTLLRHEGHDPSQYDIQSLAVSLKALCEDNDLGNLYEVDQEWIDRTVVMFRCVSPIPGN